jgi:transposase-like protein
MRIGRQPVKPEKSVKSKGKRRQFSPEFKSEAVRLAQSPGQSIANVAKDLGVSEGNLRNWIKQAAVDAGNGSAGALTTSEKQELAALRRENKELRMEREILRKATVFFAKQQM